MQESEIINDAAERLLRMIVRRRWRILATCAVLTVATVAVVMLLPNRYQSDATIDIVQPLVSPQYVSAADSATPADLVQAMKREVLSRTRLLGIIDEFGLYPDDKGRVGPEVLTDVMRKDVEIEPLDQIPGRSEFSAFRISFTANTPELAQAVTRRLTGLFIEEQLKTQASEASTTTQFLSDQLATARRRLAEQDARRRDLQMRYRGELPEQQASNMGALADLRAQLQAAVDRASRAEDQRRTLERTLSDKLAALEAERTALLMQFTDKHPRVQAKSEEIARMRTLLQGIQNPSGANRKLAAGADVDPSTSTLIAQVEANEKEVANLTSEQARLKAEIADYQNRLSAAPLREREMAQINTDADLYTQQVKDLESKLLQARQTTRVTENDQGRRFRLVDPPTLPTKASSPKRLRIALGGFAISALLGFALAFWAEHKDKTLHEEKEVARRFQLPIAIGVPPLYTPSERRLQGWRVFFEWLAASAVVVIVATAELYVYKFG